MPATRDDLIARLAELGIETTTKDHAPVYTVEEARALRGEISGGHCKNLFLKDKKGVLWLVVTLEDAQVDLKALPQKIGSGRLSFGKGELLAEVLGIEPGSVTPFSLINDTEQKVKVVLDAAMMAHEVLNYHPLKNDATTSVSSQDLLKFVQSCGHAPQIVAVA
ncbi:MAG: prolyl-tRNA synthetase associated domain-containing protein [Alphaproteobacteria bacterium]|nr:prolyl-tRNA synthetase associated domain-containing protein [Alphaproteobacteria bacterium]